MGLCYQQYNRMRYKSSASGMFESKVFNRELEKEPDPGLS